MNNKENIVKSKSYSFAIRIVKLSQYLQNEKKEFILSKQVLRSGTAIGALIREAEYGQSKTDFIHKLSIALKEANETGYRINILKDTNFIDGKLFKSLSNNCEELIKLLTASIKTAKQNINNK
ncbi:MAG TPA: four helix bundle protein [Candidatus Babeliaceae bacterium]|nr:four helix bundle protein [Candidatus Babeliaceae bacterium]HVZ96598.1 four helix bundle protein [Chitinophagaceae bacterium]